MYRCVLAACAAARGVTPPAADPPLADLIAHWSLDRDGVERVIAAAPTDFARLRLARRALASGGTGGASATAGS